MAYRKFLAKIAFGVFLSVLIPAGAWAQFSSSVDGTITDESGAVIPGAAVTLTNVQTGVAQTMPTSAAGYYRFQSLPPGMYSVRATAKGFTTVVQENVQVQVTEVRTVNLTLKLGATTQAVTVTTAPAAIQLNEASVTGDINTRTLAELPIMDRNFANLVALTPGVTGVPQTGSIFWASSTVALNAGGNRTDSNNFVVNGTSVNTPEGGPSGQLSVMPNVDMIQDVRVQVNNFSAEYGRNAGAQVNVATKQGTNQWHGTLAWFHEDNDLTSATAFETKAAGGVPHFRNNDYESTFGGPIRKNKTFFFVTEDVLRSGSGSSAAEVMPTPAFLNWMTQNVPNNLSTTVLTKYPSPLIPTSGFETAGQFAGSSCSGSGLISTGITQGPTTASSSGQPLPMIPCNLNVTGAATFSTTNPYNGYQWGVRLDQMFGEKDRLYGNLLTTHLDETVNNQIPAFDQPVDLGSELWTINETHTFSPSLLNEFSASYVRNTSGDLVNHPEVPFTYPIGMELVNYEIGPFVAADDQVPVLSDTLSWVRGRHTFKFGGNYEFVEGFSNWAGQSERPAFIYLSPLYYAADSAYEEFNLGYNPVTGVPAGLTTETTVHQGGAFFQDDYKVKSNFTLNLGLRWEDFGDPAARNHKLTNIVFNGGSNFGQRIANAGVNIVPQLFNQGVKTNFAPRLGFAWDPTKKGKLSIRGGAGIFYDRPIDNVWDNVANNLPLLSSASVFSTSPTLQPLDTLGNTPKLPYGYVYPKGLPTGLDSKNGLVGANPALFVLDPNYGIARVGNLFFGVQYALSPSWTFEADYLGSMGRHLYSHPEVNRQDGALIQSLGAQSRPNTSFGTISYGETGDNSAYNGFTLALTKRYSRGFTLQPSFTYGKTIDSDSSFVGGGNNPTAQEDIANHHLDRGLADFDVRDKLAMTTLWDLPTPHFSSKIAKAVVGGWELSGVLTLQSGPPFSVVCSTPFEAVLDAAKTAVIGNSGCDYNADGDTGYSRPNAPSFGNSIGGLSRSNYLTGIFTESQFPAPALGADGSLGRNTFHGPGFADTDLALLKNFQIPWFVREGAKFQLRAEFYNAFNRVNLNAPNADLADSAAIFGRSTSSYPARTVQLGARIAF